MNSQSNNRTWVLRCCIALVAVTCVSQRAASAGPEIPTSKALQSVVFLGRSGGSQGIVLHRVPKRAGTKFRPLEGVYEPSGSVQLTDGRLLIAEDEPTRPLTLLTPESGELLRFSRTPLQPSSILARMFSRVDDLEALASGPEGLVYAITSHSRNAKGKRDPAREQLFCFFVHGDQMSVRGRISNLRDRLGEAFPKVGKAAKERDVKDDGGLNIEGLAYDPRSHRLWLGLRGPVIGDKAMLVGIDHPDVALQTDGEIVFADPVLLDLGGGGVRGLSYVPRLGGFLVLSQEASKKGNKPFKLWLWRGDAAAGPQRVRIEGLDDLQRTESVSPVRFGSEERLLLVSDDGDSARGRAAHYALVSYSRLKIESLREEPAT